MRVIALTFVAVVALCCVVGPAGASPIGDYGVQVMLTVNDDDAGPPYQVYSGQPGPFSFGRATANGGALPSGIPDIFASATIGSYSGNPYAVGARAETSFYDDILFTVAGGGTADIQAVVAGHWATGGTGSVGWVQYLNGPINSGGVNWLAQSATPEFNPDGTWGFTGERTVSDGVTYRFVIQLDVSAFGDGSFAYIDDPMYFVLPAGVTLQSASGFNYVMPGAEPGPGGNGSTDGTGAAAVPEPASLLLLGSGLVATRVVRRRRCVSSL